MSSPTEPFNIKVTVDAVEFARLMTKVKRLENQVTELQRTNTMEVEWRRELAARVKELEGQRECEQEGP
jgi:hypothetical protein